MKIQHLLFLSWTLLMIPQEIYAQNTKGELRGRVLDSSDKKALPYATIAIYTAQDTSLVTFRVSDEKGTFRATALPLQVKLRVLISMTGFSVYRQEFILTPAAASLDLAEITMNPAENRLREVLIQAEIPPVIIRKDTLEFNAASFKTLPTALLEDLLKKLPGVTVDNAGNITVNGKRVNRILVEGKEFFGNDPKVATQNLPADIIDKVQVMNDPEAIRQDPFLPDNHMPQVINLKFKKGIKKGLFGKVYAGAGSQQRYEAGGILNMFRDTTQVSIIGYSNNLNRPGFGGGDLSQIGGFNRTGVTSIMQTETGLEVNDISFGGTGAGIQQSSGGGANFNTLYTDKLKLNLLYFYGNINSDLNQLNNTEQVLEENTIDSRRTRDQTSATYSHRLAGKGEWKPNASVVLTILPSIAFNQGNANQFLFTRTERNLTELLNQSRNTENLITGSATYATSATLAKSFKKPGRRLYIGSNASFGNNQNEQYNRVKNEFYQPQMFSTSLNQLRQNNFLNTSIGNGIIYTEPITKVWNAAFRLNSDYFSNQNGISTFENSLGEEDYSILIPGLSDSLHRSGWRNRLASMLTWNSDKYKVRFSPGVLLQSLQFRNRYSNHIEINQKYFYAFPTFNFTWKNISLNYASYVQEPSALDLQPVQNNTNPLFVRLGNPDLKPTIDNSFYLSYLKYDTKRLLRYNASLNTNNYNNYILPERFLSPEGIQTTRPVNVDGVWRASSQAGFTKEFKFNGKNQFFVGSNLSLTYFKSLVLLNDISSNITSWDFNPSLDGRINLGDKLEMSQSFTMGRQRSLYGSAVFDNRFVMNRNYRASIILRSPGKLVWDASFVNWYNANAAPGIRRNINRLNAGVTYQFLKQDRGQLKLTVFDLLNQNVNVSRIIRENLIEDVQTMVLTRYALLTFNYNIRNFTGKGGSKSLLKF